MFFQKDLLTNDVEHLFFIEDEERAFDKQQHCDIHPDKKTVYLSYPGKLPSLASMNLGIATGRSVTVELPDGIQLDNRHIIRSVIDAFRAVQVQSLNFLIKSGVILSLEEAVRMADLTDTLEHKNTPGFITQPGQSIPGSDLVRKQVLAPLFESGFIIWLYGPEKVGKGWLALLIAHVAAKGGLLLGRFQAAPNCKVLMIDGETLPDKLKVKIDMVAIGNGDPAGSCPYAIKAAKEPRNLSGAIDLLDLEQQHEFDRQLSDFDLVIIDNFYSLTENKPNVRPFLDWINRWRNKGVAFLILDHTNKEGELQGSSDKKRAADLCMELETVDYQQIRLSFPTSRHLGPEDTQPILLQMRFAADSFCFDVVGSPAVETQTLSEDMKRQAIAHVMKERGKRPEEIGQIMGYGKSSIYDWQKKAEGILNGKVMVLTSDETASFRDEIERLKSLSDDELNNEARRLAQKKWL